MITLVGMSKLCGADGCGKHVVAKGLCSGHYQRLAKTGSVGGPLRRTNRGKCEVAECTRVMRRNGMCHTHSTRVLRHGEVGDPAIAQRGAFGAGHVTMKGYRTHWVDGKRMHEHRIFVEEYLGRPLLRSEEIHHRNGQRGENTVGPCLTSARCDCTGARHNLELWSTSQPSGQRVSDKVAWAREILALYAAEHEQPREVA